MKVQTFVEKTAKVEAIQYTGEDQSLVDIHRWVKESGGTLSIKTQVVEEGEETSRTAELVVDTPRFSSLYIQKGEWLIKVNGIFDNRSDASFAKKFEVFPVFEAERDTSILNYKQEELHVKSYCSNGHGFNVLAMRYIGGHPSQNEVLNFLKKNHAYLLQWDDFMDTDFGVLGVYDVTLDVQQKLHPGSWLVFNDASDSNKFEVMSDSAFRELFLI